MPTPCFIYTGRNIQAGNPRICSSLIIIQKSFVTRHRTIRYNFHNPFRGTNNNAAPRIVYCGCDLEAIRRLVEEGKGLAICNPQFPIVSEKIVKIPMRNKNPWQLSVAIPLRPQSRFAERFFQIVQKAALPLNKKLPGRTSTSSPKAASAED